MRKKILAALAGIGLIATAAYAQWQGCNHCVPIGKGAGVTGFTFLTPSGTAGIPVVSQGAAVDPAFGTTVVAGGGTGLTTLTANAILYGNGTGAVGTARCTMSASSSLACSSAASFNPSHFFTNTTNDANAGQIVLDKNRAGGNTLSSDRLGTFAVRGFANASQQNTAAFWIDQIGASSGSNIPSQFVIATSDATGQLNNAWAFANKNLFLPLGGGVAFQGATSGSVGVVPQAVAGTPTLVLPNTSGTFAISAGASSPLSVNTTTGAIGFSGMTNDGILFASSATAVGTNRCTMDSFSDIVCASSSSFLPQMVNANTTNDAQAAYYVLKKNRAGGNTINGDILGSVLYMGFANGSQQNSAQISAIQNAASSGSNIPTVFNFQASSASGQLGTTWQMDGAAKNFNLPSGGGIFMPGSSSGGVVLGVPAAAGSGTIFQLPGNNGTNLQVLQTNGSGVTSWATTAAAASTPTKQYLTSGTGATYTTPAGARAIMVQAIAGGGGGGAAATNPGSTGGTTTFNSVNAVGGGGGPSGGATMVTGTGGSGGSGTATFRQVGGEGTHGTGQNAGNGGAGYFGGAGGSRNNNGAGTAGKTNTGGGGGGGSNGASTAGAGGGAGEYFELNITSPAATYTYTIGAGGAGGTAGTQAGGAGGSGLIIVTEYYKWWMQQSWGVVPSMSSTPANDNWMVDVDLKEAA